MWDRDNLQAICRSCHIEKTRRENSSPETLEWRAYLAELAETTTRL